MVIENCSSVFDGSLDYIFVRNTFNSIFIFSLNYLVKATEI